MVGQLYKRRIEKTEIKAPAIQNVAPTYLLLDL